MRAANFGALTMNPKPPRIVFINRFFYPDESATSQLLTDLAVSLAQHGYDVHVLCSRQLYNSRNTVLVPHEMVRGVNVHRIWTTRFGRATIPGRTIDYLTFYVSCFASLLTLIRQSDIVVAKTDPPLLSILAATAARIRRGILINWLQDIYPEIAVKLGVLSLPEIVVGWMSRLRNTSLLAAAANVVLGTRMHQYLLSQGIPAHKLRIIENWSVAECREAMSANDSRLRARLQLQSRFIVEYSGNLGRAHEFETLLAAAEVLRNEGQILFLMIGGGVHMELLKSRVKALGLPNFIFLPYQLGSQLSDSLAAADVHLVTLLPSVEGLIVPSKIYGILAAGRPTLLREILLAS